MASGVHVVVDLNVVCAVAVGVAAVSHADSKKELKLGFLQRCHGLKCY